MPFRISVLSVLAIGLLGAASAQPLDVRVSGPSEVMLDDPDAPPGGYEYVVTWDGGGTPPWTVRLQAVAVTRQDEPQTFTVFEAANCTQLGFETGCGTQPFPFFFSVPEVVEMRATVQDSTGVTATATRRVRVASEGPFWMNQNPRLNARPDPSQPGSFLCGAETLDDPSLFQLTGGQAFPTINYRSDPRIMNPPSLSLAGQRQYGPFEERSLGVVYGIADRDFTGDLNPPDELIEIEIDFPLTYGDYGRSDTVTFADPLVPSPPLEPLTQYTGIIDRPVECTDGLLTRRFEFFLNPPNAGSPFIAYPFAEPCEPEGSPKGNFLPTCPIGDGEPTIAQPLDSRDAFIQLLAERRERAFLACFDRELAFKTLEILELVDASFGDDLSDDLTIADVVVELAFDSGTFETITSICQDETGGGAKGAPFEFGAIIRRGHVRFNVGDEALRLNVETDQVTFEAQGGFSFQVEQSENGSTMVTPLGEPLTVISKNQSLPTRMVTPGFFLIATDNTISEPIPDVFFADGFEPAAN